MNAYEEHERWTDRFSDYIDGDLSAQEHEALEAHLSECGGCRRALEELRDVIARASELGTIEPPRDLWGGIAATIRAPTPVKRGRAKVIALPVRDGPGAGSPERIGLGSRFAHADPDVARPRFSFSAPQLAAASIVLVAASALATWMVGPGMGFLSTSADAGPAGAVVLVRDAGAMPDDLANEVAELESMLDQARAVLEPNTVRVLERNLAVIEQAIADSRGALALDPGNEFLTDHLERAYQRKLEYLRDAARVAEWAD